MGRVIKLGWNPGLHEKYARDLEDLVALYSGPLRPDATRAPAPLTPEREADAACALRVAVAGDVVNSLGVDIHPGSRTRDR